MKTLLPCLLLTLFILVPDAAARRGEFSHPGVLTSQAELAVIQSRVADAAAGDATCAGFVATMATKYADLDFVPQPVARVRRGDRKPQDSAVLMRESAMTAYTLTLRWAVTGDAAARDKAQSVMAAWANVYEGSDGDIGRFLDASWVLTPWCAAGELMQHATVDGKGSGWKPADVRQFKTMVRRLSDVSANIFDPQYPPGNWQTSASLGNMAAGVFLDDRALYERARDYQLETMPKVLLEPGYTHEIFRDAWHGTVSLAGLIQAAEVGRHQSDLSLYHAKYDGQSDPRILVCLRWYADPFRGIPRDAPPMGGPKWKPKPWKFDAKGAMKSTGGWEIALNFYAYIEPAENLADYADAVLTQYRPSGQDNALFISSDTLTHGDLYKPGLRHTMGK